MQKWKLTWKFKRIQNISDSSDGEGIRNFALCDENEDDAIELLVVAISVEYYNLYLFK